MIDLRMLPAPGAKLARHVGDTVAFELRGAPPGWTARLRTNIGRAARLREEIVLARLGPIPLAGASWRDLPMEVDAAGVWRLTLPLAEPGCFHAKAYALDARGFQHWPPGPNTLVSAHPSWTRSANTIYCAFPRMLGPRRALRTTEPAPAETHTAPLDSLGYTVIPPSGKLRDVTRALPHIIDRLGCRIVHLLPVSPTPTTLGRFGRFGSPYALQDLTLIDPALIEFDRRSTGVEQFLELAAAVHARGARLMLDVVINHTGWGSRLFEERPEWFVRRHDGEFVSPGAWDVVWEDLVELKQEDSALWELLAEAFLTWSRRGVDAFRCDAGYKIPVHVWQYITARVQQEFPNAVFLLEGLGGPWDATESLLGDGGMQWAYSELFQNFGAASISGYLDHAFRVAETCGPLVHYSETHDNIRLAARPDPTAPGTPNLAWSRHRNRLCALTSVNGGFGFTSGVEWGATERVNVHSSRGLAWGAEPNLVAELSALNRLLAEHPCFFDGAALRRLSEPGNPVYLLRRDSRQGADSLLVAANTDFDKPQTAGLPAAAFESLGKPGIDLLDAAGPQRVWTPSPESPATVCLTLGPGEIVCLASTPVPKGLAGEAYRNARAVADWAVAALMESDGASPNARSRPGIPWIELAAAVAADPAAWMAAAIGASGDYRPVVVWEAPDAGRVTVVPPGHWLWIRDPSPFRARLTIEGRPLIRHVESIPWNGIHMAAFAPTARPQSIDASLRLRRLAPKSQIIEARLHLCGRHPQSLPHPADLRQPAALALLTNGRGAMARLRVDLGSIQSKYDCLLAANLDPAAPVDRHVFLKRLRAWVNADGFISPLTAANLIDFEAGPPAHWRFIANAGDGRSVEIHLVADLLPEQNCVVLQFTRPDRSLIAARHGRPLPAECQVALTIRLDIEDRSFHAETKRNPGAEHHFSTHCNALPPAAARGGGFAFAPTPERRLRAWADAGAFHPEPEWSTGVAHPIEGSRGQEAFGDAYSPGWFELPLPAGQTVTLVATAEAADPGPSALAGFIAYRAREFEQARFDAGLDPQDAFGAALARAVRAYLARRGSLTTLIAGYPWFLDWGRDSLIGARGLAAAGLLEETGRLVAAFAGLEENGTLPNTLVGNAAVNRDTSDAPLWLGVACADLSRLRGEAEHPAAPFFNAPLPDKPNRTLAQTLRNIACGYLAGTPNGIFVDPASALVWSPPHFTWMDTNHPAGTPRDGYPVEIQALWIRLLRQLDALGAAPSTAAREPWASLADRAETSFHRLFWLEEHGWFADVLNAPGREPAASAAPSNALRGNALFAITLGINRHPDFLRRARLAVAATARHLVVPGGLRSLAPLPVSPPLPIRGANGGLLNDPANPYWPRYEGDEDTRRKPAYHNGTAWGWQLPTFAEALDLAYPGDSAARTAARAVLASADRLLWSGCIGHLPEILDGDAPHTPRGCDAQAWSVTEMLRVWRKLSEPAA